ncbi:propanediol utilization protein PduV [Klebsiella pneumoniae subsp. rhinoscleromatis]|nr:propanediol utilization protein PduV [Klebsiella pneumoniae subsp. rhinoscleromatis]
MRQNFADPGIAWRNPALSENPGHSLDAGTPAAIDTQGEYLENRCLYSALLTSACEADVIALVLNADAPWSPFSPGFTAPMNRPVIGVITKADLAARPVCNRSGHGSTRRAPDISLSPAR